MNNNLAIIGLATMGANFAKNFASKGTRTAVFNRTFAKTQELLNENNPNIFGYENLEDCINSLELPRKIFLLVKAGSGTDETIEQILPLLSQDDILVDCGNSNYNDTIRRQDYCESKGIKFIGCGISGGSDGALLGPSLMPGGHKDSVDQLLSFLEPVSAKDFNGGYCVTNVGLAGAGHFIKMVHNGIEYAIMQGIAEIFDTLNKIGYDQSEIQEFFSHINTGDNKSFLLDITEEILVAKDNLDEGFLVNKLDSRAGAKGTCKWTIEAGMNLGVAVPSIFAGLNARVMTETNHKLKEFVQPKPVTVFDKAKINVEEFKNLLYEVVAGFYLVSYEQGLELIQAGNAEYNWNIDILEVLRIWQGGCIIRSRALETISSYYQSGTYPQEAHTKAIESISRLQSILQSSGIKIPLPVINSTIDYILSVEAVQLPQNLVQAQRDLFGAHTYRRIDREGDFTGGWK